MLRALLLDLDDTLLDNPMGTFVPAYLDALARFAAPHVAPETLVPALLSATREMERNDGDGPTNEEVFAAAFYPALGMERETLEPVFVRFYAEEFGKLQGLTRERAEAVQVVRWALERDLLVVIATNPLFPRTAIEQRLAWAGLRVEDFDFALVTSYEAMHATKSSPQYYREILRRVGCEGDAALMVGDDWHWDVEQPAAAGVPAYWIADPAAPRPADVPEPIGQGRLVDFWAQLSAGNGDTPLAALLG